MEKIYVDEKCIACGACVATCSEVFEFSDEGVAQVIEGKEDFHKLEEEVKDNALDALEGCPVDAIHVEKIESEETGSDSVEPTEEEKED